jgi:hypothetical protein
MRITNMHFTMKKEDLQTMKMIQTHNDSFKFKVENFKNWTVDSISLIDFLHVFSFIILFIESLKMVMLSLKQLCVL